jgi:large subunit ribosomal protein L10e
MRNAFGKAVGTAARVIPGQKIYTCFANPQSLEKVKDALRHGGHKLPSPTHLEIDIKSEA